MKIAVIDADLIGRKKHRFPNLACEKISGYYKERGDEVKLELNYDNIDLYDHVFISKVFTDTEFPNSIKETNKIHLGGTGFFFDKAPNLPYEMEHHMPDYHLYFKQGMDERILTEEKCEILFSSKYDGDYTFAFDNIADYDLIHKKLEMIRKYTASTSVKFYVLVGLIHLR